jgi:hypothetical protein
MALRATVLAMLAMLASLRVAARRSARHCAARAFGVLAPCPRLALRSVAGGASPSRGEEATMLRIYELVRSVIRRMAEIIQEIERRDADLARQMRRALTSVALNHARGLAVAGAQSERALLERPAGASARLSAGSMSRRTSDTSSASTKSCGATSRGSWRRCCG